MTHACLRAEMDDVRKTMFRKERRHAGAVGQIQLYKAKTFEFTELGATCFLQFRIVIRIQIIKPDDLSPGLQQATRDMKANKACRSGDKNRAIIHSEKP